MMTSSRLDQALMLIDRLEQTSNLTEQDLEALVFEILSSAGYATSISREHPGERRPDMWLRAMIEGRREKVGVEVKAHGGRVSGQTIFQAMDILRSQDLDRILIIALGGFSNLARDRAEFDRLGKVDLLTTKDLRAWLRRHATADDAGAISIRTILKTAMRALALRLAEAPEEIYDVEWRDMERLLGEVFETLGFDTQVTPSAQDGGYDVRLADGDGQVFLVEVKHWRTTVGSGVVRRLVEVTAREAATAGIILATGDFAPSLFDGQIELRAPPIHLGGAQKITSLCRAFYRAETQLWQADLGLADLLLADTRVLEAAPARPPELTPGLTLI